MRRKIKILYILDHFFSGGTQKNIKDFLDLCEKDRFNVTIYTLFGGNAYFNPCDHHSKSKVSLFEGRFNLAKYAGSVFYIVRKLTRFMAEGKFDIVHIRLYAAYPVGVIAARLAGVKHIIYTIEASRQQLPFYCFPIFRLFSGWVEYFLSYYEKEYLDAGLPKNKFRPYEGGINLDRVRNSHYDRESALKKHGLNGHYPIILSVGRLYPDKGHQYAIDALARIREKYPKVKLVILGEGLFEPHLRDLVRAGKLEDAVYLAGFHNDIGEFHAIGDICVKTAINEPTNLAAMLGMAYGNPIVAFDTGFEEEIITHLETGYLVENKSPEALADGILRVLEDSHLRTRLSSGGKALVFERYDIRKVFQKYQDFYEEIMNG